MTAQHPKFITLELLAEYIESCSTGRGNILVTPTLLGFYKWLKENHD